MATQIQTDHFTQALYGLLDETFDKVQGYFLDKGASMFETLATISAEEASAPVGGKCATPLAAQVKHRVSSQSSGGRNPKGFENL
jgi:hypothetical protein